MTDERENPIAASQRLARPELPKRFFQVAEATARDGAYALTLDGKTARTPGRAPLVVADKALAEALAAEWSALGERIDPAKLPLTRIINSAIDGVADQMDAVRAEVVKYVGTDLVCYRAEEPAGLVAAQEAAWEPLVSWMREVHGVRLALAAGIVHVPQPEEVSSAVARALQPLDALTLAAVHTVTTLSGSAVIALAQLQGKLAAAEAWAAAHVDEDWQMEQWGQDELALERRAARWREMEAAGLILDAWRRAEG